MLITQIFEAAGYEPYRYPGGERLRIGVWFNSATKEIIDTTPRLNHAEQVIRQHRRFGITDQELRLLRAEPDFEYDWNESTIKLANTHGWVRVMAEGPTTNMVLNLQSTEKKAVLAAARHFVPELSPTEVFIDFEVESHNNVWHTKLEDDQIDRYLRTGRLPSV